MRVATRLSLPKSRPRRALPDVAEGHLAIGAAPLSSIVVMQHSSGARLMIGGRMAAGENDQDYPGSDRCREETGYQRYHTALLLWAPRLTEASGRLLLIVKGFGFGQARSGYRAPILDRWVAPFLGVYLSKSLFDACGRRSLTRFPWAFGLLDLGAGVVQRFPSKLPRPRARAANNRNVGK
jgi:hypothetical protein